MIPTPYTVGHKARILGALDAHRNPAVQWAEAEPLPVRSISGPEGAFGDPSRIGKDVSKVIHAPAGRTIRPGDVIVIDGDDHKVATVVDWTKGPWVNPAAGLEIHLTRQEG